MVHEDVRLYLVFILAVDTARVYHNFQSFIVNFYGLLFVVSRRNSRICPSKYSGFRIHGIVKAGAYVSVRFRSCRSAYVLRQ